MSAEKSNWKSTLRASLKLANISARALARKAGLSTSTVHDMLNKPGFAPQINNLEKVFEVLGVTIGYIDPKQPSLDDLQQRLKDVPWKAEISFDQGMELFTLWQEHGEGVLKIFLTKKSHASFSQALNAFNNED